ncbi:coproporphyrinogen-III oxidase family protein [Roseibium album]|uniref:coproporphyrinogen-III oxidase family protein n=1 Tax=Roseibium album TaxID=311410 RepID=UPI0024924A2C|nr:coproporphyrinogen-III oxidase family protein [Roseibium album]
MQMKSHLEKATARMERAYANLPSDYFNGKNASTYLFNNITRVAERAPPLSEKIERVIERNSDSGPISLYFGVPWCEKICAFCNFAYSTSQSADVHEQYIKLLHRELALLQRAAVSDHRIGSVYFGGGTPTILQPATLKTYIESTLRKLNLTRHHSVTVEFSTNTITPEKLTIMKEAGVTRISTGIQSLDDKIRERANLVGTSRDAMEAVSHAQNTFDNFNIDLIYGHPYQTDEDWYSTVLSVVKRELPSITLYRMEVKTRTSFKKMYARDEDAFGDEHQARRHYFIARIILEEHNYVETPLGWWIRKETLVNATDWRTHLQNWRRAIPYFGLGQGAFSLATGAYYSNHTSLTAWRQAIEDEQLPVSAAVELSTDDQDLNQLMRLLRVAKSVNLQELFNDGSFPAHRSKIESFFEQQISSGLFSRDHDMYSLTEAGESLVHWIFEDLTKFLYPELAIV